MTITYYILIGLFFVFNLSLIYNFRLKQKEKIVDAPFNFLDQPDAPVKKIRQKMLLWTSEQIKQFQNETVYIFAGEFNYEFYDKLLSDELNKTLMKNNVTLVAIGGPYISISDEGSNKIIEWAKKGWLSLHIRNDDNRTIGHGVVAKDSDKLCILEDPHDEFSERSAYAIHNSKLLCGLLRQKVEKLIEKSTHVDFQTNGSQLIEEKTRSREQIEKTSHPIKQDNRIPEESYLSFNKNPIKERNRLKWLAQVQ